MQLLLLLTVIITQIYGDIYCGAPLPTESPSYPGLTLKFVQTIVRHGDRTPERVLPTLERPMPIWDCSLQELQRSSSSQGQLATSSRSFRTVFQSGKEMLRGNCGSGQLTLKGYKQHLQLGQAFRKLYIEEHKLLDPHSYSTQVRVRSTNSRRTIQSAEAQLDGMLPNIIGGIEVIDIETRDSYYEDMWPSENICPAWKKRFDQLQSSNEKKEQNVKNEPLLHYLHNKFQTDVTPTWDELNDVYSARRCHGYDMPVPITDNIFWKVREAAEWDYNYQFVNDTILSRLGMSSLLHELYNNLLSVVNGTENIIKYMLYSGHDSTIGPLLASLRISDGKWPAYASYINMELWSNNNTEYFLNIKYNSKNMIPTGMNCNDTYPCSWNIMGAYIKSHIATDQECQI